MSPERSLHCPSLISSFLPCAPWNSFWLPGHQGLTLVKKSVLAWPLPLAVGIHYQGRPLSQKLFGSWLTLQLQHLSEDLKSNIVSSDILPGTTGIQHAVPILSSLL